MAVITMLLTALRLKLERTGRQAAQRRARNPRDFSSNLPFTTDTKLHNKAANKPQCLIRLAGVVQEGFKSGSAEVKQAADGSHGNRPVFRRLPEKDHVGCRGCNGTLN